ncbi:MAG: hypothetical protein JRJ56_08590, partial [Deltaproteobacteria bacterium]|nr:hypothetical protein [Deltaproteobacteria bacterium]
MAVRRLAASPASGGRQDSRPAARRFFLVVLFCLLAWLPASRARALPPTVAAWYLDECVWDGSAGEVRDSGGHGYDGTAVNGVTTTDDGRLCRAGRFNDDGYLALPDFPDLQDNFTITAWIRTRDRRRQGQRVFADDERNRGGYALSLGDGG